MVVLQIDGRRPVALPKVGGATHEAHPASTQAGRQRRIRAGVGGLRRAGPPAPEPACSGLLLLPRQGAAQGHITQSMRTCPRWLRPHDRRHAASSRVVRRGRCIEHGTHAARRRLPPDSIPGVGGRAAPPQQLRPALRQVQAGCCIQVSRQLGVPAVQPAALQASRQRQRQEQLQSAPPSAALSAGALWPLPAAARPWFPCTPRGWCQGSGQKVKGA